MNPATQKETWKPVSGYDGLYEVSNLGRVRSYQNFGWGRKENPKLISLYTSKRGYVQACLCRNNKSIQKDVHRLVAEAFLTEPASGMQIDHINGIKSDNRLSNLEWVTPQENSLRAVAIGLKPSGENHGSSKLTQNEVDEIRQLYATGKYSHRQLGEMFGISHGNVGKIVRYQLWKSNHIPKGGVS
jgi:hypothetical protein